MGRADRAETTCGGTDGSSGIATYRSWLLLDFTRAGDMVVFPSSASGVFC